MERIELTEDDISFLNRSAVSDAARLAFCWGTALIVVGAIGLAAALWTEVRQQQHATPIQILGLGVPRRGSVSLTERIDLFMQSVGMFLTATIALAIGGFTRLAARYTVLRTGGSITERQAGDRLLIFGPDADDDAEADDGEGLD